MVSMHGYCICHFGWLFVGCGLYMPIEILSNCNEFSCNPLTLLSRSALYDNDHRSRCFCVLYTCVTYVPTKVYRTMWMAH